MKHKAIWGRQSRRDVIEAADFIARDSLDAAERFISATESTVRFLVRNPKAGALREWPHGRISGVRSWRIKDFPRYLVFYRLEDNLLVVLRVLHSSRDIDSILNY